MLKKSARKYLQNIRVSDNTLCGNCNLGDSMSEEKGYCGYLYMSVMDHRKATIISMGLLEKE